MVYYTVLTVLLLERTNEPLQFNLTSLCSIQGLGRTEGCGSVFRTIKFSAVSSFQLDLSGEFEAFQFFSLY